MQINVKSNLITDNLNDLDTPLSLSCVAENLRMAALHFEKAKNFLEHAALAFESNNTGDLSRYKQSANKHQVHALQYASIADVMVNR